MQKVTQHNGMIQYSTVQYSTVQCMLYTVVLKISERQLKTTRGLGGTARLGWISLAHGARSVIFFIFSTVTSILELTSGRGEITKQATFHLPGFSSWKKNFLGRQFETARPKILK